jgi:hypothetical protein
MLVAPYLANVREGLQMRDEPASRPTVTKKAQARESWANPSKTDGGRFSIQTKLARYRRVTATPDEIRDVEPAGAAVSLILPQDTPDIRAAFCCHVHFFASAAAAHDWPSKHAGVDIVNIHDAFGVGRERAQGLLRTVRSRNTGDADRA